MASKDPTEDSPLAHLVQAPLWLVLLAAGSGVGWSIRPATDPDYVSKVELLEKLDEKLGPVEQSVRTLAEQGVARGYEMRALESRIRALELAVDQAHGHSGRKGP